MPTLGVMVCYPALQNLTAAGLSFPRKGPLPSFSVWNKSLPEDLWGEGAVLILVSQMHGRRKVGQGYYPFSWALPGSLHQEQRPGNALVLFTCPTASNSPQDLLLQAWKGGPA